MAFFLRKIGGSWFVGGGQSESTFSETNSKEKASVDGVWGSDGRVFIASNQGKQLVVTDSVPRPRWNERYSTITESGGNSSRIVAVLPNPSNQSQIYLIHSNSITECLEHNPLTSKWTKRHQFQLSNAKGAEILSVTIHPGTSMFFWCEKRASTLGLASCCLCMREVPENWDTDVPSSIGAIVVILHSCPLMSLFVINKGVCLVPQLPDEHTRVIFFWTFVPRSLKVHVWNHTTAINLDKTDFKSIIMELLPVWHSFSSFESKFILALTTHPSTLELLLLDNSYSLSYAVIQDGQPLIQTLCVLSIQSHTDSQTVKKIFAIGLFVGLVWDSGLIDVFDSKSGTALCTLTELTGMKLNVWTHAGTVPGIGVWSSGGIWEFKSSSVVDVAEVIQTSVKPTKMNVPENIENHMEISENKVKSDEMEGCDKEAIRNCTVNCSGCHCKGEFSDELDPICKCPNCDKTFSGPVAATIFLHEWNLFPLEAKVALSSIISKIILDGSESFIEKELLDKVVGGSFQSPVFALSLLFNHPLYKDLVIKEVQNFLEKFQSEANSDQKCIKTVLNNALFPYMHQFVALEKKFDDILGGSAALLPSIEANSSFTEAKEILHKLNMSKPDCQSVFRLNFLQSHSPREVVESVDQYIGLNSPGNENVPNANSQHWRKLYRLEWKDGQWQKSRAAPEDSNNPFLSLLCNMLYNEEPDWLLNVKENGMAVVNAKDSDERAQEHITQSFLDCLPALKVDPSRKSTHVHSKLLWAAGQEMQALQVLLRHEMWSQALDFFSALPKDTNSIFVLFCMMIKAFLRCSAPKEVSLKALTLVPHGLCTYEILSILRDNGPRCTEPFESATQILTIGDVRPHLQQLIA